MAVSEVVVSEVVVSDVEVVVGLARVVGLAVVGRVTAAAPFVVAPATEPEEVPTMPDPEEVPTMPEPALAIGTVAVGVPIGRRARASAAARSSAPGMQSVTV